MLDHNTRDSLRGRSLLPGNLLLTFTWVLRCTTNVEITGKLQQLDTIHIRAALYPVTFTGSGVTCLLGTEPSSNSMSLFSLASFSPTFRPFRRSCCRILYDPHFLPKQSLFFILGFKRSLVASSIFSHGRGRRGFVKIIHNLEGIRTHLHASTAYGVALHVGRTASEKSARSCFQTRPGADKQQNISWIFETHRRGL